MPKRRLQHQRSPRDKSQISLAHQNKTRNADKWWIVGIFTAAIIGGIIGYFSLPNVVSDVVDASGNIITSVEGVRLLAVGGGCIVFLILGLLLKAGIDALRNERYSRRALFWWGVVFLISAIIGAIPGYFSLPNILLPFARILLGASLGVFGMALLLAFIANPKDILTGLVDGIDLAGCLEGCFSRMFVLLIASIGAVSGLLIWHSLLLSVFTGGGSALVALIAFVGLAFTHRKEKIFHGSKATAPKSLPTSGA